MTSSILMLNAAAAAAASAAANQQNPDSTGAVLARNLVDFFTIFPWWGSTYVVKEYGDKSFHVYQVCRIFGLIAMPDVRLSVHTSLEDACAWCEKQIKDSKVKSVTYVMED